MAPGFGWRPAAALLVIGLGAALAGCGSSSTSSSGGGGGTSGGPTVTAKSIAFNPTTVTVAPGGNVTLTFVNQDSVEHSVTFDSDSSKTVDADPNATVTLSFTAP